MIVRSRTFVLTQQIIGADEAKTLGVISEIVTRDRLRTGSNTMFTTSAAELLGRTGLADVLTPQALTSQSQNAA
jgi:enoyl-CoA hydratase/carnithine racemase